MALLCWMVSGPEIARVIHELESSQEIINRKQCRGPYTLHHEQAKVVQTFFNKQTSALCATMEKMGNPFMEQSKDLIVLDRRDILDEQVALAVQNIEKLGQNQYELFVQERLGTT